MTLRVGDTAPDFLIDAEEQSSSLYELLETGLVVVYFYPRDFTMGCTIQAKGFRNEYDEFRLMNTHIVGISSDSEQSHCDFREVHTLPFPLVADVGKNIAKSYKVSTVLGLVPDRVSFVIGPKGRVLDCYRANILVASHVRHIRDFIRVYRGGSDSR